MRGFFNWRGHKKKRILNAKSIKITIGDFGTGFSPIARR
jgi:hypothetical protein